MLARTPILTVGDVKAKREEIRNYFDCAYLLYERLFDCLAGDDAFYAQPEVLRHPLIFYFGHTAVFYINKLADARLIAARLDESFERMFAVGVDEMSWDDLNQDHYDWPTVDRLREYRKEARRLVHGAIDSTPLSIPIRWNDPFWIILMGIEHERIHLETSSVLIRQLGLSQVQPSRHWPSCQAITKAVASKGMTDFDSAVVRLGRALPVSTYAWDNELGQQLDHVAAFRAQRCLTTNAEYLQFVRDGGYEEPGWWSEEGWRWRSFKGATCPPFWVVNEVSRSGFRLRNLTAEVELPLSWPAEVNCHEAEAFNRWISAKERRRFRLPTEAEWYRMYDESIVLPYPEWGEAPGNIDLAHYSSSCPVDAFEQRNMYDIVGNVWQWTVTPTAAFDGFQTHPAYDDFSVPTFGGKHNLIKGGSWISTGNEAHHQSRYAFRRHFYQHAGFRLVESI